MVETKRKNRSRSVVVSAALAAAALLVAACQPTPPPPPPPPERIQLEFRLTVPQPLVVFGYQVGWRRAAFQMRTIPGYEFCDPRVTSQKFNSERIREPFAPGEPEFDGVIADGWIYTGGRVVFTVVNNGACWNKDLWDRFGGHPYDPGWDVDVDVLLEPGGVSENFSTFAWIDRGEYNIVK